MKRHGLRGQASASLPLQMFYSVAELARAGNVPTYRLLRLLRKNGVTFLRAGRAHYVTLDEIRRRLPPLWRSLKAAGGVSRGANAPERPPDARSPRAPRTGAGQGEGVGQDGAASPARAGAVELQRASF